MTKRLLSGLQLYDRQARLFFVVVSGLGFAIDGVYTILFNLYLLRLGYGTEFIGLVNAVGLLTFAVISLPAGIIGARVEASRMLKFGMFLVLLGGLLLPFAELAPTHWQDSWLLVTYAMMLSGFSFYFVNGAPFVMGVVKPGRHNQAFALQTALLSLSAFVGSLVGGILPELFTASLDFTLDSPEPYRYTLMIVTVVLILAFLCTLLIKPADHKPFASSNSQESPSRTVAFNRFTMSALIVIGLMSLVRLLQVAGIGTAIVFFNVYMDTQLSVSSGSIGLIAAIGRLLGVPTALLVPYLVHRWKHGWVVIGASMSVAVCLVPLALIPNWFAASIGFIGAVALTSIRFPAFLVYILELVPQYQQSVMAGAGEMAAGLSFAVMALGGGYVLAYLGFQDLFLIGACLSILGTLVFWLHFRITGVRVRLTS